MRFSEQIEGLLTGLSSDEMKVGFKRGEILTAIGSVEKHIYHVLSGAVIAYRISDEDEQVMRLGYSGNIINALPSFLSAQRSEIGIRAIRSGTALRLPKQDFEAYVCATSEHQSWYTKLLEDLFIQQTEREIDLLTFSPSERLARVLKRSPTLFQEVPAKYIASYLRMSPETLSRMM